MADFPTIVPQSINGSAPEAEGDVMVWTSGGWRRVNLSSLSAGSVTNANVPMVNVVVDLGRAPAKSGRTTYEATFTAAQVGKPVLMCIAPGTGKPGHGADDEDLHGIFFTASVVSTSRMVVRWFSQNAAVRGMVRVNYLIGT